MIDTFGIKTPPNNIYTVLTLCITYTANIAKQLRSLTNYYYVHEWKMRHSKKMEP